MSTFESADTVRYYFTPIGFLEWSSDTGERLCKLDGIAWDSTLFTAPRGTWDTGDARLRVPWRLLGCMVDPVAVDYVRAAWLDFQGETIRVGKMPVWRLACKLVPAAKGTSRARVIGVDVVDGFWCCFAGPARDEAAFGQLDLTTGEVLAGEGDQEGGDTPGHGKPWDGDAV